MAMPLWLLSCGGEVGVLEIALLHLRKWIVRVNMACPGNPSLRLRTAHILRFGCLDLHRPSPPPQRPSAARTAEPRRNRRVEPAPAPRAASSGGRGRGRSTARALCDVGRSGLPPNGIEPWRVRGRSLGVTIKTDQCWKAT